jgi:hypothetical protein
LSLESARRNGETGTPKEQQPKNYVKIVKSNLDCLPLSKRQVRAAWSEPLLTKDNEASGTFALYSHEAQVPTEEDLCS